MVAGGAGGGAAALGLDAGEDTLDGGGHGGGGALEELLEAGRVGAGRGTGGGGQGAAVVDAVHGGGPLRALAVVLHDGALGLGLEGLVDGGSRGALDLGADGVALEGQGAHDLGGVEVGVGEGTRRQDVEQAALAEVVQLGGVEVDLDGLAGLDNGEGFLGKANVGDGQAKSVESEAVL